MKRIDVLKGIEQILVQKAYETGHISHRADGDWQKTNNGWVRVKGSPAQPTPQAQEPAPAENTEYGEITEEDLKETPDEDIFSEEAYAQDEEDRQKMSNYDVIKHIINDNHDYDTDIKTIEFRDEGDGELAPHDDDYFRVVDKIWSDNDGFGFSGEDFEDEDSEANELYDNIVDLVIDRAYALRNNEDSKPQERKLTPEEISELVKITDINERKKRQAEMLAENGGVQKSAIRDMRSIPATKNMGF